MILVSNGLYFTRLLSNVHTDFGNVVRIPLSITCKRRYIKNTLTARSFISQLPQLECNHSSAAEW